MGSLGVYTRKPLKAKEVAENKGVTYCVRQLERNFLRHLLSNKNAETLICISEKEEGQ